MAMTISLITCKAFVWFLTISAAATFVLVAGAIDYSVKSGIQPWIDPATPLDKREYTSSRGGPAWELVMSDEFNRPNRSFRPGEDHMWTSLEQPDGVNGALELYSHNMTSTACDGTGNDSTCYLFIKVVDEVTNVSVYNAFSRPPAYETATFFYRSAMLQSWNKFCFQGGMLEVRAQLPGATSAASGNPDIASGSPSVRVDNKQYYPTWPGIWMMGNLGRAIFSASTTRMWPFSYDRCEPDIFESSNQRISACDDSPGYGLNPNQGRGAPEIDLLEGGGDAISSSLQIAPGMPSSFRLFPADADGADEENPYCVYTYDCKTQGANYIDVPTAYYEKKRGHKSWYQGLRYAANDFCAPSGDLAQSYESVSGSLKTGITDNTCSISTCPASLDVNCDLGLIDSEIEGVNSETQPRWGINSNGTCFPFMNSYMGAYLCDPDNTNELCGDPRNSSTPKSNVMPAFNYQMDAISANWPIHVGGYTDFLVYQIEWVTGEHGYIRWMLAGSVIFEVTASTILDVPQNSNSSNPIKLMIEEPMSIVLNVALSWKWGVTPPNAGAACRGDGLNDETNRICDSFPLFMKIDYVRIYQDVSSNPNLGYMQVGCDPVSHPTREWINNHLDEYQNDANPVISVAGMGFCTTDDDCTIGKDSGAPNKGLITGRCSSGRCSCLYPTSWGGPRCTSAVGEAVTSGTTSPLRQTTFGPSMVLAVMVAMMSVTLSFASVYYANRKARMRLIASTAENTKKKNPSSGDYTTPTNFTSLSTVERGALSLCESVVGDRSSVSVIFL